MTSSTDATSSSAFPAGDSTGALRTLIAIATYNEIESLPRLLIEIHERTPEADVLIVDDNSPDGTGEWVDTQVAIDPRMHVLHRAGKLGLGTATIAGMQYAIEHGYDYLVTMDADNSHHPRYLRALISGMDRADVAIGSRYTSGGSVKNWPLKRRLMSRGVNLYARMLLGLPTRDNSGAFRCFRVETLKRLDFTKIRSRGYSFFEEVLWLLKRQGARFWETPIEFVDREFGQSKINTREAVRSIWIITRLGLKNWLGF